MYVQPAVPSERSIRRGARSLIISAAAAVRPFPRRARTLLSARHHRLAENRRHRTSARSARSIARVAGSSSRSINRSTARAARTSTAPRPARDGVVRAVAPTLQRAPVGLRDRTRAQRDDVAELVGGGADVRDVLYRVAVGAADLPGRGSASRAAPGGSWKISPSRASKAQES